MTLIILETLLQAESCEAVVAYRYDMYLNMRDFKIANRTENYWEKHDHFFYKRKTNRKVNKRNTIRRLQCPKSKYIKENAERMNMQE